MKETPNNLFVNLRYVTNFMNQPLRRYWLRDLGSSHVIVCIILNYERAWGNGEIYTFCLKSWFEEDTGMTFSTLRKPFIYSFGKRGFELSAGFPLCPVVYGVTNM